MVLPIAFPDTGEGVIASYSFVDLAGGTGVARFYFGVVKETANTEKTILSTNTFYSNRVMSGSNSWVNGNPNPVVDIDWDVTINRPINVEGNAYFNIPLLHFTDATDTTIYPTIKLRKVSDSVESDII